LEVVTRLAVGVDQFFVPAVGANGDAVPLSLFDFGTILFGAELDCKCVTSGAEGVLASVLPPKANSGPAWPYYSPAHPVRNRLSAWTLGSRPEWLWTPGSTLDCPLLVGASGVKRKVTRLPPYDPPTLLVSDLRTIASMDGPVLVRMTPVAEEGLAAARCGLLAKGWASVGDPGPHLRRWMRVLAAFAIGINPRAPVITDDLLPLLMVVASGHSMLMNAFWDSDRPAHAS
jgi:hypothetical protein